MEDGRWAEWTSWRTPVSHPRAQFINRCKPCGTGKRTAGHGRDLGDVAIMVNQMERTELSVAATHWTLAQLLTGPLAWHLAVGLICFFSAVRCLGLMHAAAVLFLSCQPEVESSRCPLSCSPRRWNSS